MLILTVLTVAQGFRWMNYNKSPKIKSYVREVKINPIELSNPLPDTEYFYRFEGVRTIEAGQFPFLKTTTTEDSLGIYQRKNF
jgi:hypothetical protein